MEYNPHRPSILGEEWVPVTYEPYQPDASLERGYRFTLGAPAVPQFGQYVLDAEPTGVTTTQYPQVAIYRAGEEDATGPARTVIIPAASVAVTGGLVTGGSTATVLRSTSDLGYVALTSGSPGAQSGALEVRFDTSTASATLAGKRILNVSVLYTAGGDWVGANTGGNNTFTFVRYAGWDFQYGSGVLTAQVSAIGETTAALSALNLGEINPNWTTSGYVSTSQRYPWRNQELQLFGSVVDPMRWRVTWSTSASNNLRLYYAGLAVTYCEENRVLVGATHVGARQFGSPQTFYAQGLNTVVLRTASTFATGAGLPPGPYTVTCGLADVGDTYDAVSDIPAASDTRPVVQALRQRYEIPGMSGVEITRPRAAGDVARATRVEVLPCVSFAATGTAGVHADTHAYGRQFPAPVYAGVGAGQLVGAFTTFAATQYQFVRFYARRFGDATAPLVVQVAGDSSTSGSAQITAAEFDALPQVAGGWREVTLRLSSPVTMSGTYRQITWTSASPAGERWEVLAADGDALNTTANYLTGLTSLLSPLSTNVITADAAVMLSTELPAPSSPSASAQTLPLGVVPLVCAEPAGCIPTGVSYNQVSWVLPAGTAAGYDTFTRTASSGWGTSDTGQAWAVAQGGAAAFSANGTTARVSPTTTAHVGLYAPTGVADYTVTALISWSAAASGAPMDAGVVGRWASTTSHYRYRVRATTAGLWTAAITRMVAGVETVITPEVTVPGAGAGPGAAVRVRAEAEGSTLRWRVWADGQAEPAEWTVVVTDTSHTSGQTGLWAQLAAGSLTVSPVASFDSFALTPVASIHGWTEIQRLDQVDQVWETIARITSPGVSSMRDYEARTGSLSYYRIRRVNSLGFEGVWAVAAVISPAPGVTGAGAANGTLIFTSNADQAGARVFAYTESADSPPSWDAAFAEADQVSYQQLYDRDFVVAEHGTERGGSSFSATLLTGRGAPSLAALEDGFRQLRDLAWADLPYVCVRTERGDRWLASVTVPQGSVRRRTGDYIKATQVRVVEVSAAPYPVDIPWGP